MGVRPYFSWRIDKLESLYRASPDDRNLAQALLDELEHRHTDRAMALRSEVAKSMEEFKQSRNDLPDASLAFVKPQRTSSLDSASRRPMPAVVKVTRSFTDMRNAPAAILASWVALEALSPQTYRKPADLAGDDASRVASLDKGLPWMRQERSRPGYQLYYQVVLGSIPADRATGELSRVFGTDEERPQREREKASIAAVLLDRNGLLLDENALAISSFAWALPIALSGDLATIGSWASAERGLLDGLEESAVGTGQ